jgi:PKD repeat protein
VVGAFIMPAAAEAANPIACFTQAPAFPTPAQATTFDSTCSYDPDSDDTITSRAWDLDDDGSYDDGTGVTSTRSFAAPGTYTVRLFVRNQRGTTDTETRTVTVNAVPTASFTNTPAAPTTGALVSFNSTSTDTDGTIASYAWALDADGAFNDGTAASTSRTFTTPGTYTVKLRVTDNRGAQNTSTRTITVANRGPTASFGIDPASASQPTGQNFTFTSTSTDPDGTISGQAWDTDGDAVADFNDGTGTTASKSFPTAGTYTIRLRVTDNNGATNITTRTVTATNRVPTANFTISPAAPSTGQTVTFTSTSVDPDGTIASQAWDTDGDATADFNDGTGASASRSFATAGNYTIRLRVTDNNGATNVVTKTVPVGNRLPVARFTVSPNPLTKQPVTFTSTSADPDGAIASFAWDLDGDSTIDFSDGTGATASRTWDTPGVRPIRLRVTDNNGGQASVTVNVSVGNRSPLASFTIAPETIVEGDTVTLTSTASDEDGTVEAQSWDLDNDGAYDDGTAATAAFTAGAPGTYTVGLRAVDNSNVASTVTRTLTVGERPVEPLTGERTDPGQQTFDISATAPDPSEPPAINPVAPLRFLDPFPVVRMRGRTTGKGAKLTAFTVRAPHGAVAQLLCKGRGCPVKKQRKTIRTKRKRGAATIHFPRVERFLLAGTELQVLVTQRGMVGKYTRIKIRRQAVPIRSDRCLLPDSAKPATCPAVP